jgi:arylsulfatase A-like enzyme
MLQAIAIGLLWYAIEAVYIAVGDTTLDGSELIWRFLHFLPWQIIAFTTIGVATAALAAWRPLTPALPGWLTIGAASFLFLGARVAEGTLHNRGLPAAALAALATAVGIAIALGSLAAFGRLLPRRLRPAWPVATWIAWTLLFLPFMRRAGAALALGKIGLKGSLAHVHLLDAVLAILAAAAVLGLATLRRRPGAPLAVLTIATAAFAVGDLQPATAEVAGARSSRPDVLIILVDTLRADHLGGKPNGTSLTPRLDARSSEFFRFTRAFSTSTRTEPAMPGIMTSLPYTVVGSSLPPEASTLAERLQDAGYATFGISANPKVSPQFGYDQGFDEWHDPSGVPDFLISSTLKLATAAFPAISYRSGLASADLFYPPITELRRRGIRLLEDSSAPTFLYLQTMDVHGPYLPPKRYLPESYRAEDFYCYFKFIRLSQKPALLSAEMAPKLENLRQRYAAGASYTDAELDRLFQELEERGRWDETLVWIFADHGEAFGEHGFAGHGAVYVGTPVIRVPLRLKLPRSWGLPTRSIDDPVSLYDVLPTTLSLLGLPALDAQFGVDLASLIRGEADRREGVVINQTDHRSYTLYACISGPWKLDVAIQRDGSVTERALRQLERDPGELEDVARGNPAIVSALEAAVRAHHQREGELSYRKRKTTLDPSIRERLRSLGYADDGEEGAVRGESQ